MRIPYEELKNEFKRVLLKKGFAEDAAEIAAATFADNTCDGVYSHGINRFPRVVEYIDKGYIKPKAKAKKISGFGALENWNGNLSLGVLAARQAMNRAIELAADFGIGCVSLRNTNHWMRGGTYGWQAAEAGFAAICWTNTLPNMPAWGGRDRRIGNNPLVIAIPRRGGHVVLDMAMSQFSYGKLEEYRMKGTPLPVPGGYDAEGALTTDPFAIEQSLRLLPIGYWKGSGLSIVLDLLAAGLSGGNSTADIGRLGGDEFSLSQVMIAIDPTRLIDEDKLQHTLDDTIAYIQASLPVSAQGEIYYPGERTKVTRADHLKNGIPVNEEIWKRIQSM